MDALLLGLAIGFAAGVTPGPLFALVISSTLRSGWRAGALAACAPLVTDALVIAVALLVLDGLPQRIFAVVGVVGAVLVLWMGIATIRDARGATLRVGGDGRGPSPWAAVRQGAIVNLLSPHPWIAWATALGPLTIATWRERPGNAVALLVGFYVMLVGTKVVLAVLVAGGRRRLGDVGYRRALVGAGGLLVLAAVALAVEFVPAR